MTRKPAVAGSFYPGTKAALENQLDKFISPPPDRQKVIGLISPHAGYVYSGACAGKGFEQIEIPNTVIILGVNHSGIGHSFAVDNNDFWNTPLGDIALDNELGELLVSSYPIFQLDPRASSMEHSLEVQVPFIQYLNPHAKILPITISSVNLTQLLDAADAIAETIKGMDDVLMVASTDMSHYLDAESARHQDQKAIDKILDLDPSGLFQTVRSEGISMCGVSPTTMLISAANKLGAKKTQIAQYTNSGEVSGDFHQVVGYLSVLVR